VALPAENVTQKAGKKTKIPESVYRDTTNVEHEIFYHTGNSWNHRNSNTRLKKNLEPIPWEHSIDSAQKIAVLGTSHIIGKYCNMKLET